MKGIVSAAAGLAAALAIAAGVRAGARTCQLQSLGELHVTVERGDLMVDGAINGAPARFILDSGSPATMLFAPAVGKLGLVARKIPNATFYGVGGPEDAYSTWVRELRVAGLGLRNATLFVSRGNIRDATGLLGALFLLQTDVEFDLAHGAVRFFKAVNCTGDQVVYWGAAYSVAALTNTVGDSPKVMVKLNGEPVAAEMDTGSPRSVVTIDAARRFGKVSRMAAAGQISGLAPDSKLSLSVAAFDAFSFGDETIGHASLGVADLFAKDTVVPFGSRLAVRAVWQPQMLLGADFFRSHRVYFSRDQRKVYVSYQGGPVFASPSASSDAKPAGITPSPAPPGAVGAGGR